MKGWRKQKLLRLKKKRIKIRYILLLFLTSITFSIYFLRLNNLKMVELRQAVVTADEQGDDVKQAILNLNQHIFQHMNTTTIRPVELVNSYNKAAQAAIEASDKTGKDVYQAAARACERRGIPLTSIAQCAADYAARNNPNTGPAEIKLPDKSLFIYSFASPRWTPDTAGFAVLTAIITGVWLILRTGEYIAIRLLIRKRLRSGF